VSEQSEICEEFGSQFYGIDLSLKVGIALSSINEEPLHAVRTEAANGTSGWYIWGGEFSDKADFFDSLCGQHLDKYCPHIIKYLALEPNYRIMIDRNGFEDVWRDNEAIV
jgi:hypothetical protein